MNDWNLEIGYYKNSWRKGQLHSVRWGVRETKMENTEQYINS